MIQRMKQWVDPYYPGTKLAISEYNFGGDTCITSTIAHCEVLAIYATYGVSLSTRWSKPAVGSMVIASYKIFLNYDGQGASIFSNSKNITTIALGTTTSDIETAYGYAFETSDKKQLYIILYNKDQPTTDLTVNL
eukprot:UN03983